ncbi:hypothetical protein LAD70_00345 [Mycoplasma sp. CH-Wi4]|nr:hypothetical protein [Mycoplasma tauri]MBZ4203405.1 hypothetical protein [Mycoplasma tauri]MBZ4204456.1 hypothetical protein [Mycoplasma tauri]MBZ4226742.1 hypothetical protein [Mycoplasma tauri]
MELEKYIQKYNPKAIFLKGSRMFNINSPVSDNDIEILIDSDFLPQTIKDDTPDKIDVFFVNYKLNTSTKNKKFKEISLLQYLFLKPEHILYKSVDFDFEAFKKPILNQKNELIMSFIKSVWATIRYYGYSKYSKKNIYHICYISSLVDNSEPNWEIIKRLKEFSEDKEDQKYYDTCRIKLLNFYINNKIEELSKTL